MKKNDKKDLSEKTIVELRTTLAELKKEFAEMSIEKEQGKLSNTGSLANTRRKIAFVNTVISQKGVEKNV